MTDMAVHYSSATDQWETPQEFFAALDAEFDFFTDVCATAENAKCARFFTPERDGLKQTWTGTCWCNPPYGRAIKHWVKKAYDSAQAGAIVVMLIPARTDAGWWHDYVMKGEVRFIRGRLRFSGAKENAPFPSAVVVFRPIAMVDYRKVYWGCHPIENTKTSRPSSTASGLIRSARRIAMWSCAFFKRRS